MIFVPKHRLVLLWATVATLLSQAMTQSYQGEKKL